MRKTWLGAAALVAVLGCTDDSGRSPVLFITDAQEAEIGQGVDVEIEDEYKIVDPADPLAKWAVELVAPLAAASAGFRDPAAFGGYKVEVIADDELVNAFAAPGGYTYISTGLVLHAKTCAEIAGVLGHEIGHVTERHGVRQLEQSLIASEIAKILLDEGIAQDIALLAFQFLQSTQFSQDQEAQSDSVGLQVALQAGYNPYGLVDFFQTLLAAERRAGGSVPQFLSSHPATDARIAAITAEIEQRYGATVDPGTTQTYACMGTSETFEAMRARIQGKQFAIKPGTGEKKRSRARSGADAGSTGADANP